ncbi:MAG TPA: type IV pilus assembly protein PilM [Oligoflexia bacterium]|nr:type IV pilus assembly protein PilM [Oligoflexia bacterium]HMR25737.1 type IV pilus assembly protein PilM [Oligoflexia bacterium]
MFFKRSNELVGVDLGSSSIKLVALEKVADNQYHLKHFRMLPLPKDTIIEGAIMDSAMVIDTISKLYELENIKEKNVATSISGNSVIVKKLVLPQMSIDELEQSIQWDADQYIPFDVSEVNLDVKILKEAGEGAGFDEMEILLAAAKKEVIADYVSVFEGASLKPVVIDLDVLAVGNMFEVNYPEFLDRTVLVANIGASMTNINIVGQGSSKFTRDVPLGGVNYTSDIQKQLQVSFEEAEDLKIGGKINMENSESIGNLSESNEVGAILHAVSESIAVEIQRSIDFFASQAMSEDVSAIFLTGGGAKSPGLKDSIMQNTELPTEIIDPFKSIYIDGAKFDEEQIKDIGPVAGVAVGLALREVLEL